MAITSCVGILDRGNIFSQVQKLLLVRKEIWARKTGDPNTGHILETSLHLGGFLQLKLGSIRDILKPTSFIIQSFTSLLVVNRLDFFKASSIVHWSVHGHSAGCFNECLINHAVQHNFHTCAFSHTPIVSYFSSIHSAKLVHSATYYLNRQYNLSLVI